ncbi:hypothetical protein [Pseudomonas alabamensis]|uniref:hypothetical protein n=1 Tax=Pseudomonas alabamensis TaxID=3064349 RepID=UPI003D1607BE
MLTTGTPLPAWPTRVLVVPLTAMPSAIAQIGCQNMTLASSTASRRLGMPRKFGRSASVSVGWAAGIKGRTSMWSTSEQRR